MELHIKSILIFLCVGIVHSHGFPEVFTDPHKRSNYTPYRKPTTGVPPGQGHVPPGQGHVPPGRKLHTDVNVSSDNVHVGKPVYFSVRPGTSPLPYNEYMGRTSPDIVYGLSLFFLEKDMKPGHQMSMNYTRFDNGATFIPRQKARTIPFSTNKMPEILNEFSVDPESDEAQIIEETIKGCEVKDTPGERNKYCATSLEDMVEYAKYVLGNSIRSLSTKATNGLDEGRHWYTFGKVRRVSEDYNTMVCHKLNYVYAVFSCQRRTGISPHIVSVTNENGTNGKVVAICHEDTSHWDPNHLVFRVLGVNPGSSPICHFLPEEHLVWVRT